MSPLLCSRESPDSPERIQDSPGPAFPAPRHAATFPHLIGQDWPRALRIANGGRGRGAGGKPGRLLHLLLGVSALKTGVGGLRLLRDRNHHWRERKKEPTRKAGPGRVGTLLRLETERRAPLRQSRTPLLGPCSSTSLGLQGASLLTLCVCVRVRTSGNMCVSLAGPETALLRTSC
uniref:uncharacterized protein LOC132668890 isoform X2 n=1 Tax=Panthera onca TaxID=9690 RepID=UPI00295402F0|nr:uncharacterized protein LOC132668890 isoform X2 [Panthera onca]